MKFHKLGSLDRILHVVIVFSVFQAKCERISWEHLQTWKYVSYVGITEMTGAGFHTSGRQWNIGY